MSPLLAAAASVPSSGAGAPIRDIALVGGIISAATIALLTLVVAYRRGGAQPLRLLERLAERYLRIPGWAAIPGLGAIGAAVLTFMGAIWDIGIHIDKGRDNGPFGTTAHYPLLAGLVLVYLSGVLAVGMAPRARRRTSAAAIPVPGLGPIPVGALLILAGGGYAMLGFPLDDLWHRVFGQDVTLWGPTHTMFFGGLIAAASGAVILMAEGARTAGYEPFGDWRPWRRPLPAILGGIFLFVGTHATDEFNWGLPQYRQVWQPLLLAFFGALGLVLARSLGGRGATAGALAAYLPLQLIEVVLIGALGTTRPASVLFVAEALVVELVAWRASRGRTLRIGALAGLAVGTVGFAAEYAWSHVAMPLPWHVALLPEAIPVAALAGVSGGVLAVLMTQALTGGLARGRRPLAIAVSAAVVVVGLGVNAAISHNPKGVTATLGLSNFHTASVDVGGRTQVADLRVRLSRPDLARHGDWAYVLGWQGGGRFTTQLVQDADGTLHSRSPVPIGGHWKSFVRIHKGRAEISAAVRMPADPALGFRGFPAQREVTRPMVRDTKLLQIERKNTGPLWAWTPALLLVMTLNLMLMVAVAAASVRAGRTVTGRLENPGAAEPRRTRPLTATRPLSGAEVTTMTGEVRT
jgi:hypothetical protein